MVSACADDLIPSRTAPDIGRYSVECCRHLVSVKTFYSVECFRQLEPVETELLEGKAQPLAQVMNVLFC